jgi:hypothetical protein
MPCMRTRAHENHMLMSVGFGVRPAQRDALQSSFSKQP